MKKSLLIAFFTVLAFINIRGQVLTHTTSISANIGCAGTTTISIGFYVTGTGTISPYGNYEIGMGTIGAYGAITSSMACTSWYSLGSPGTMTATIPTSYIKYLGGTVTVTPGTYQFFVKWSNSSLSNSEKGNINVLNSPSSPTISASGSTSICPSSTLQLTSTSTGTVLWSNGQTTPSIIVSSPNAYYLNESNQCGAANSNTINVTQLPLPSIAVSAPSSGCNSVSGNANAINTGRINWNNGQSGSAMTATVSGTYYAIGVNSCGTSNSNTVTIIVNPNPTVNIATDNLNLCAGQNAVLTASGANSYTWNIGQTTNTISVTPTVNTSYTVTGTDVNGCTNSINFTQNVSTCTNLSVQNMDNILVLYPNPNKGDFVFECKSDIEKGKLIIYNYNGQIAYQTSIKIGKNYIEIMPCDKGLYFYLVFENDKKISAGKIIID